MNVEELKAGNAFRYLGVMTNEDGSGKLKLKVASQGGRIRDALRAWVNGLCFDLILYVQEAFPVKCFSHL